MTYHLRSLVHHWRTNVAVVLGTAAGAAALTGALLIGDSMRASLRNLALSRLGRVDYALIGPRFFEQSLANRISAEPMFADPFNPAYAMILLRGGVTHAELRTRVDGVGVIGVDEEFWNFQTGNAKSDARDPSAEAGRAGNLPADRREVSTARQSVETNEPRARSERSARRAGNLPAFLDGFAGRSVLLNRELADELRAKAGDAILLRLGKPSAISTETLMGRRDQAVTSLRLNVAGIVPDDDGGQFSLNPAQSTTRNIFVPMDTLQRAIDRPDRANAIIVASSRTAGLNPRDAAEPPGATGGSPASANAPANAPRAQSERSEEQLDPAVLQLQTALHHALTLGDLGLHLRIDHDRDYIAVESDSILIDPTIEKHIDDDGNQSGFVAARVLAHLANRISTSPSGPGIPYSTIVAHGRFAVRALPQQTKNKQIAGADVFPRPAGATVDIPTLDSDGILLNQWAADDLDAKVGDDIYVTYYVTAANGELNEQTTKFKLAGVVPMDHKILGDPGLVPSYPGVTNVERLSDWDAPFPIDFTRIRDKDDQYWEQYRALPKAFIQLEKGQELWTEHGGRFGNVTSIFIRPLWGGQTTTKADSTPTKPMTPDELAAAFTEQFLRDTRPNQVGLSFQPVRAQALAAATGSTDFGGLFIGFSFFVIISAAMLVALLFRLGVERRAEEIGLLMATGFDHRAISRMLLAQGAVLAFVGTLIGLAGAGAYAWLMLAGLRTWWSAAVGITAIKLAIEPVSLAIGALSGVTVAMVSIAWALRGLTRLTPRALLAGAVTSDSPATRSSARSRAAVVVAIAAVVAVVLVAMSFRADAQAQAGAFFGAGAATLTAILALLRRWLHGTPASIIKPGDAAAITRLGIRNAPRNAGRSLLTAGLIASATFVIASIQAFRLNADPSSIQDKDSGSGGFNLYAESAAPLPYDLATEAGRDALGFDESAKRAVGDAVIRPLRLRPGDESSCLNLYRPTEPRILAASEPLIRRGGFAFSASMAETDADRANPWLLLEKPLADGAVPAIGDEAAVKWQLHSGLGHDLVINDERGRPVTLRFVALLKQSLLQDELVIPEPRFVELFPSIPGPSFFLIAVPPKQADEVETVLERSLERYGLDVHMSLDRLNRYLAVQNTYLATFRNLGGLGLLLGTTGLAAVLLRNVWERRRELALLRAVGFSHGSIGWMVLVENVAMLIAGLGAGAVSSLVAIAPAVMSTPGSIPWPSLIATLAGVLVIGVGVCALALIPAIRTPLISALRAE